eukprot:569203-Prymnesium_polylepis.3
MRGAEAVPNIDMWRQVRARAGPLHTLAQQRRVARRARGERPQASWRDPPHTAKRRPRGWRLPPSLSALTAPGAGRARH